MRVLCTLPNASSEIGGIVFKPAPSGKGMLSEEINADVAFRFGSIPGYEVVSDNGQDDQQQKRRGRPRKIEADNEVTES